MLIEKGYLTSAMAKRLLHDAGDGEAEETAATVIKAKLPLVEADDDDDELGLVPLPTVAEAHGAAKKPAAKAAPAATPPIAPPPAAKAPESAPTVPPAAPGSLLEDELAPIDAGAAAGAAPLDGILGGGEVDLTASAADPLSAPKGKRACSASSSGRRNAPRSRTGGRLSCFSAAAACCC